MRHADSGLCGSVALSPGILGSAKRRSFTTLEAVEEEADSDIGPDDPLRQLGTGTCRPACSSPGTHAWGCVLLQNSERAAAAAGGQLAVDTSVDVGARSRKSCSNDECVVSVPALICSSLSCEINRPDHAHDRAHDAETLIGLSAPRGNRASQVRAHQPHDRHSVQYL